MKILQVNCVYDTGSTGKITADLHRGFTCNKIESVVCYGRGKKVRDPNVYKVCSEAYSKFNNLLSRFTGVVYGGCFFSTNKLIRIIKREKPDIVHLQCINGYFVNIFRLVGWLKKNNIKTVLTLHAEFMFTANCGNMKVTEINIRHMAYTGVMAQAGFDLVEDTVKIMEDGNCENVVRAPFFHYEKPYVFLRDVDVEPIILDSEDIFDC